MVNAMCKTDGDRSALDDERDVLEYVALELLRFTRDDDEEAVAARILRNLRPQREPA